MGDEIPRRSFAGGAAAAFTLAAAVNADALAAPSNQVRLGIIGTGNRGRQLIDAFKVHSDAKFVAACDVYRPHLDQANAVLGGALALYDDFRALLDRKDLDAVVIATPDHWHALIMIAACTAGKDVYVEKPLSITIVEGRRMVEAAQKSGRVVQVGLHRRSTETYHKLVEVVRSGAIGKVTVARAYRLSNMWPAGVGKAPDAEPPAGLNWDMWLGPRPKRPFNPTIAPYKFRWRQAYSSQMANWGVHYIDAIRWALGDEAPRSVVAMGGRFAIDDSRDVPDTMEATFELPSGCLMIFGQYEASGNPALRTGEIELRGTLGTLYATENSFEIFQEYGGQFQSRLPRGKAFKFKTPAQNANADATSLHARNFLDCVKSRRPCNAGIEAGHRSTIFALLANISLATRARLEWDAEKEQIVGNSAANKLLHYEYRSPWTL